MVGTMTLFDERGSALVAAVGLLSVMTLLAVMSLMAGGADLAISARQARERSVFYAAESALETTLEELASGRAGIPESSFHAPWPAPGVAPRSWQDGPWACSRRVCLVPDVGDADGNPATTVVLFDRSFGQAASPLQRDGFPLVQLLVTVEGGGSRHAIVAEVAPVTCAPVITAAWTAAGPLELAGDIRVAGTTRLAAVAGRSLAQISDGAVVDGESLVDPLMPMPTDVLQILNPGGTLQRLEDLPEPPAGGTMRGLFWSRGDFSGPLDGEGILVVHNPSFNPVKHEASRLAIEEGILVDGRDPLYSHLDPSRQPARLGIDAGGSFSGVVIADAIGGAAAAFTLTGGLITLVRSPLEVNASSPLRINGSLTATAGAGRGAMNFLAGFRPVATVPAQVSQCP
jgi:hypothetical protein